MGLVASRSGDGKRGTARCVSGAAQLGTGLHCTALHCTALHCTAPLHCAALRCTALRCAALRCAALHHCTAPCRGCTLRTWSRSRRTTASPTAPTTQARGSLRSARMRRAAEGRRATPLTDCGSTRLLGRSTRAGRPPCMRHVRARVRAHTPRRTSDSAVRRSVHSALRCGSV
jgi:hypothetical protein